MGLLVLRNPETFVCVIVRGDAYPTSDELAE